MKYVGIIVFVAIIAWLFVRMLSLLMASDRKKVELELLDEDFSEIAALAAQKGEIVQQLRDLEVDYNTGKIDEEQYKERREKLENKGVSLMRELDKLRDGNRLTEQQLEEYRQQYVDSSNESEKLECPDCGEDISHRDRFCRHCGCEIHEMQPKENGNAETQVAEV